MLLLDGQIHHDTHAVPMGNYVIEVGNYVIVTRSEVGNYVSADMLSLGRKAGTDQERRKCYRWSAWFLVSAAASFLGGYLDTIAARTTPPRT